MILQKRVSGNSYYLLDEGKKALKALIDVAKLPEPTLKCRPIGTKLSRYILIKIIKQYYQDSNQEAVSIGSWMKFFNYYYNKLSTNQQQYFMKSNCAIKTILSGNYTPVYLTAEPPYPKSASVSRVILPQEIAELMWKLDYSKSRAEISIYY